MEMIEEQIVSRCQRGKLEEFEKLYDRYFEKIYRFIYYKTHHKETAEDLTIQTFLKALHNIQGFESDKGSFPAWIYRIARNTVIDYYRTQKRNLDISDVWDLGTEEDIERDSANKERLEEAMRYLEKIDREHREIVIMRVWHGLSHKEIAKIMGKKEENCRVIFSRTIGKLREDIALSLLILLLINQ